MITSIDKEVKVRLRKHRKGAHPRWYKRAWMYRYLPSGESLALVMVPAAVVFLFTLAYRVTEDFAWVAPLSGMPALGVVVRSLQFAAAIVNPLVNYDALIGIHAALTTMVFAFFIAITVSLRQEEETDKARVLLKASSVYLLACAAILGFPTLMVQGRIPWKTVPPLVLVGLSAMSAFQLLRVLIDRKRFTKERMVLLKDLVKRHMDLAEGWRLGRTVLHDEIANHDIELVYNAFAPRGVIYHNIYPPRTGVIIDVLPEELKAVARIIDAEAFNVNNFTFRAEESIPGQSSEGTVPRALARPNSDRVVNSNRYVLAGYHDHVDRSEPIICFDQQLVGDPRVLAAVRQASSRAFKIEGEESVVNLTDVLKADLAGIRDQFEEAIRTGAQHRIDEFLRVYVGLGSAFSEYQQEWRSDDTPPTNTEGESRPAMHEAEWIVSDIE